MADINSVTLVGRLTRDAEMKYTGGGMAICEISLAVNSRRKQGDQWVDEAHFFDVTVFGRQGEAIQQYLTKGKQVGIEGRLKQDRWQTQEGQNRSKVGIVANNVMLLGGRDGAPSGNTMPGSGRPSQSEARPDQSGNGFGSDSFPDDIPF